MDCTDKAGTLQTTPAQSHRGERVGTGLRLVLLLVSLLAGVACTGSPTAVATEGHALPTLATQDETLPPGSLPALETGMHTALISHMSVDAAQRVLVTASHDKTVRLWDLATGRLLQVIRPPVRAGHEGKLYAVAVSPDGLVVAAAGATGYTWNKAAALYVFRVDTGAMLRRVSGFLSPVTHLAYSHEGQFLAASSTGQASLRVYRTPDETVVARDAYSDTSYSADFSVSGHLVTASYDGFLRLYDREFTLRVKRQAPSGTHPFAVAFSPDGSRVAVGYRDAASVDVLDAGTLAPLYRPDTTAVERGGMSSVCWSADGQWLYAGGLHRVQGGYALRRWADGGRGAYADVPVAESLITHLLPFQEGGVLFATGAPSFGVVEASGPPHVLHGPVSADFRDIHAGFFLSHEGTTVQFSYEAQGKTPARFALRARALVLAPRDDTTLVPPRTTAPGIDLAGWDHTPRPTLNGKALRLVQSEVAHSAAIAPDHQYVLLGTEWFLRLFDRRGVEQWSRPAAAPVWGVNIAGNGQVAVAACGDGTLHWYRLRDGQELLTFFPHRDRERWVLWTPSGYYDAAPDAEQWLGWLVDHGPFRAGTFLPLAPFRSTFFRPDVVTRIVETGDEAEALRRANAAGAHP